MINRNSRTADGRGEERLFTSSDLHGVRSVPVHADGFGAVADRGKQHGLQTNQEHEGHYGRGNHDDLG